MLTRFAQALGIAALIMLGLFLVGKFDKAHAEDAAIGDSIALGTGRALHVHTFARVGASSCWVLAHMPRRQFEHVVISAGINDAPGRCVRLILAQVRTRVIVVILPAPINSARAHVEVAAVQYGAYPISYACKGGCTTTNFHPGSYTQVARDVRNIWDRR